MHIIIPVHRNARAARATRSRPPGDAGFAYTEASPCLDGVAALRARECFAASSVSLRAASRCREDD